MTPDEINAAIAEHIGWTGLHLCQLDRDHPHDRHIAPHGCKPGGKQEGRNWNKLEVPEFDDDLNAMQQAFFALDEDSMAPHSQCRFLDVLGQVLGEDNCGHGVFASTAAQRAETFLRTVGKWEGDAL